ncbi:MAG TPA: choice-of-anchor L domain-containing protein, partial [Polyangiaceae bacterium]
ESVPVGGEWTSGGKPPPGYPKDSSQCDDDVNSSALPAYNDVMLELVLRAPSNAQSFSFDSLFLTYEYPDYLCSAFNDFFVVLVDPPPDGLEDDDTPPPARDEFPGRNVLFDAQGDPVGVNSGLLSVCRQAERGRAQRPVECTLGPALLADTGFDQGESTCAAQQTDERDIGGASTGWLHTSVPVPAGKLITIRILLWDNGDPLLDSTVVIDNFQWSPMQLPLGTGPISSG